MKHANLWSVLAVFALPGCRAFGGSVLIVVLAVVVWVVVRGVRRHRQPPHDEPYLDTPVSRRAVPEFPADDDHLEFLRTQFTAHRAEWLQYAVWLEGTRRGAPSSRLKDALGGVEPRLATPVLYLHTDKWIWKRGELASGVARILKEMQLPAGPAGDDATESASAAIAEWAEAEASRLLDDNTKGEQ